MGFFHSFTFVSSVKSVSGPMASTTTLKYGPKISLSHVTMKGGGRGGPDPFIVKDYENGPFFFEYPPNKFYKLHSHPVLLYPSALSVARTLLSPPTTSGNALGLWETWQPRGAKGRSWRAAAFGWQCVLSPRARSTG